MAETILSGNPRMSALVIGCTMPCVGLVVFSAGLTGFDSLWYTTAMLGSIFLAGMVWATTRPRLAYADGELLAYLHPLRPQRVPIDIVEVFFLGQAPVPGFEAKHDVGEGKAMTANVVVRLAEAAKQWRGRDSAMVFGTWKDGYITIVGLWCEPLNADVIKRMNHRLAEIKRTRKEGRDKTAD